MVDQWKACSYNWWTITITCFGSHYSIGHRAMIWVTDKYFQIPSSYQNREVYEIVASRYIRMNRPEYRWWNLVGQPILPVRVSGSDSKICTLATHGLRSRQARRGQGLQIGASTGGGAAAGEGVGTKEGTAIHRRKSNKPRCISAPGSSSNTNCGTPLMSKNLRFTKLWFSEVYLYYLRCAQN